MKSGEIPTIAITPSFNDGFKYSNFGEEILEVTLTNYTPNPGLRVGSVASLRST